MFVGLGLAMGLLGSLLLLAASLGVAVGPDPRLGLRLVSLGMVLSLVLGMGGLLVPTFTGVPRPLEIAGIAAPHERRGRLPFYAAVAALLVLAFVLESLDHPGAGAWVRALAATPVLILVWKIHARPARRDLFSLTLRGAGWCVLAGLWLAALLPLQAVAAYHVVFIGGFGLLTLGIATRVVAAHGGHGAGAESRVLTRLAAGAVALALGARLAAAWSPEVFPPLLATSGVLWALAWSAWLWRAAPLMLRARPPLPGPGAARQQLVKIELKPRP
jgi:uncharacterized protein involved in response to NO